MAKSVKKTFVFNYEWAEALEEYSPDVRLEVYEAVIEYAVLGTIKELRPLAKMAFSFIKKEIDYNTMRYNEVIEKRREAGKKGMSVRYSNKKEEAKEIITNETENNKTNTCYQVVTNITDNDNDNDNDNDIILEIVPSKEETASKKKKFIKPTVEEVQSYIQEKGFTVNAQTFIDYYTSNGWRVGKNPMKDWKAAVRTWQQKEKQNVYGNNRTNYSKKQEANNYAFQQYLEEGERIARGERVYTSDPNSEDNPF